MMGSSIRMIVRRVCLRKAVTISTVLLCAIGLFGFYHFTLIDEKNLESEIPPPRNIIMPLPVNLSMQTTSSTANKFLPFSRSPIPNIIHNATPECLFSTAQPKDGRFNVQMSAILDTVAFDNSVGGVWKQGFEVSYSMDKFSAANPLQVFIVPHSHNDPGWLKTFEDYYRRQTRNILNLMTDALSKDKRKKFVWAEISFLDLWWQDQGEAKREQFKKLVASGQLEIVTGGWVMNDEANTHYFAMLDQLMEGHLWMQEHLPEIAPHSGWANDPFGYSPTMAYLLKGCGIDSMLIQRAHYIIKKHLARNKQLEFQWTQEWDDSSATAILCHLMPFYSYDVPHTCGPDPKVCCQFDFHRLPGSKVNCPWKIRPQAITDTNVKERAETLADQYRKKSILYKSNVLLVPLGDDFRWDTDKEIRNQFSNYFKLIDYMNGHPEMKIKVQFGTLSDYFKAVRQSMAPSTDIQYFPSLAGDFFTYADRDDHYWSGYYTSRPFHKHMDRVLQYYLRMAEMFYSVAVARGATLDSALNHRNLLTTSRRALGLFQHHDGITGTAKDKVVDDYATKMMVAVGYCTDVTQDALKALTILENPSSAKTVTFTPEESYPTIKVLPEHEQLNIKKKARVVTFVNSLAHHRLELVSLLVNSADVMVLNASNVSVASQLNPVLRDGAIAQDQFQLVFVAALPALGQAHYLIATGSEGVVRAELQYINHKPPRSDIFKVKEFSGSDFVLTTELDLSAKFSGESGLLKAVTVGSSEVTVEMDFVSYGTSSGRDKSGAYLFLPNKEASSIVKINNRIITIAGPLLQEVWCDVGVVKHSVTLSNFPGIGGYSLTINNLVDVRSESNKEIAMRLKTSINNRDGTFYTDLNGFQLTQRKTRSKIPLQGNFYPMPTTAILQDNLNRLTLYSRQPLGAASLKKGWLEVVLDRRLMQDDKRGLAQGVKDSVLTHESFRLLVERRLSKASSTAPLVYPSLLGHYSLDTLLHPPATFISPQMTPLPSPSSFLQTELPCDLFLLNLRSMFVRSEAKSSESALILHRRGFDCGFDMSPLTCSVNNGSIKLGDIFKEVTISEATESSLSLFHDVTSLDLQTGLQSEINEMQIKTYRLAW